MVCLSLLGLRAVFPISGEKDLMLFEVLAVRSGSEFLVMVCLRSLGPLSIVLAVWSGLGGSMVFVTGIWESSVPLRAVFSSLFRVGVVASCAWDASLYDE